MDLMEFSNRHTRQIAEHLLADEDIKLSDREWDVLRDSIYQAACEARRRQSVE